MLLFPPCWLCLPCALAKRKDIKTALQVARLRKNAPGPTTESEMPLVWYYTAACYSDAAACGAVGGGGACGGGGEFLVAFLVSASIISS